MSTKKKTVAVQSEKAAYMYIGPSIRGKIQQNTIYYGTRDEILKQLADVITEYPTVKRLIVKDTEVADAVYKIAHGLAPYAIAFKKIQKGG